MCVCVCIGGGGGKRELGQGARYSSVLRMKMLYLKEGPYVYKFEAAGLSLP